MAAERGSPEWWRDRLIEKYGKDLADRELNAAYYDSINPSPDITNKYRAAYQRLLGISKTPWGRLVVDIVAERLKVNGFRLGDNINTDDALWSTFTENKLQAVQGQVHREALALGTSYMSVWPNGEGSRIAFESGMAMTHETRPGDPHEVAGAIKLWHDSIEGRLRCNLYLPDAIYRWQSQNVIEDAQWQGDVSGRFKTVTWEPIESRSPKVENPFDRVNIVPFVVRPNWQGYGQSDLEDLRPIIARIESITANTLLAVELGAFRQRWATGLEVPVDPNTNQPVEPFKVALDRLWTTEDPDARFGSFDSTDVRPYLQAVSDAIGQLSSVSRIPTLYFNQSELSNPPSAASLEATETGLIKKVIERQNRFAESWEEVVKLVSGTSQSVTVSWDDPRTRSEAQMMDAAIKLREIGMPWEALMEYLGYSPTDVARLKALRSADTFSRLLETPLPSATRIEQPVQAGADEQ